MASMMEDVEEFLAEDYLEWLLKVLRDGPITEADPMTNDLTITMELASLLEKRGFYLQAVCAKGISAQELTPRHWNIHPIGCTCRDGFYCLMGIHGDVLRYPNVVIVGSNVPHASPYVPPLSSYVTEGTPRVRYYALPTAEPPVVRAPLAASSDAAAAIWTPLPAAAATKLEKEEDSRTQEYLEWILKLLRNGPITAADPMTNDLAITVELAFLLEKRGFYLQAVCEKVGTGSAQVLKPLRWNIHPMDCRCSGDRNAYCLMTQFGDLLRSPDQVLVGSKVPSSSHHKDSGWTTYLTESRPRVMYYAQAPGPIPKLPAVRAPPQATSAAAASSDAAAALWAPSSSSPPEREHPAKGYMDDFRGRTWKQKPNSNKLDTDGRQLYADFLFHGTFQKTTRPPFRFSPMTDNIAATERLISMVEDYAGYYLQVVAKWDDVDSPLRRLIPLSWNVHEKLCRCLGTHCVLWVVAGMPMHSNRVILQSKTPPWKLDLNQAHNRATVELLKEGPPEGVNVQSYKNALRALSDVCQNALSNRSRWPKGDFRGFRGFDLADRRLARALVSHAEWDGWHFRALYPPTREARWEVHRKDCRCQGPQIGCELGIKPANCIVVGSNIPMNL